MPHNNIRSNSVNHQTKTGTRTEYGQNSYVQNINKAMQDTCFQKFHTAYSPMTLDIEAQHTSINNVY